GRYSDVALERAPCLTTQSRNDQLRDAGGSAMTMTESEPRQAMRGLKGKNVLITGGTSGIGQAIAVRFAEHGANVAINYLRSAGEADETHGQVHACVRKVQQEGVRDVLVGADVSNEDEVVRMVAETVE